LYYIEHNFIAKILTFDNIEGIKLGMSSSLFAKYYTVDEILIAFWKISENKTKNKTITDHSYKKSG